jgi:transposase
VQPRKIWSRGTGQPVHPLDLGDDRLAGVLEALSDDGGWATFEGVLNRQWLRVYDLRPECVRLDSTTASGYWTVTEDGLFPWGPSKEQRLDRPQGTVMLSALEPLGVAGGDRCCHGARRRGAPV